MNQENSTPISWKRIGAWQGGSVAALSLSPNFMTDQIALAATAAGVYRSIDGGQQWQLSNRGLTDPNVFALHFAPTNRTQEKIVFAATENGRLFTSLDSGQQWHEITAWAGLGVGRALAISPNYAQDGTLFVATGEGVLRSQDGGKSWESSTFGLLDLDVLCIACASDYAQSETLWTGTVLGGLYRSRNAARSWRDAGMGLPESAIQCLLISPDFSNDQTLWVGTETAGVYISTNGGESWASCSQAIASECINCLAMSATGAILAGTEAGIFISHDMGKSWHFPGQEAPNGAFLALALAIAPDGAVLAGAYQEGIFCSHDGGQHWQQSIAGLAAHVPPLTAMSAQGMLLALDVHGTLALSADAGVNWQIMNPNNGNDLAPVQALAISQDETNPTLYVASGTKLWRALVTGMDINWQRDSLPAPLVSGQAAGLLALSPRFTQDQTLLLSDGVAALYLSTDGGITWNDLAAPWQGATLLNAAITPWPSNTLGLDAITAMPDADGNYRIQLWHTANITASWELLATLHTETLAVAYHPYPDPVQQIRLLGTRNRIIKLFMNPGSGELTVEQIFLAEDMQITTFATAPNRSGRLYVATNRGVFASTDHGTSWHPFGGELFGRVGVGVFPNMPDGPVFLVTLGGEVWSAAEFCP